MFLKTKKLTVLQGSRGSAARRRKRRIIHEKQHRECGCDVDDVEEDKDKGIGLNNKTLIAKELTDWDL